MTGPATASRRSDADEPSAAATPVEAVNGSTLRDPGRRGLMRKRWHFLLGLALAMAACGGNDARDAPRVVNSGGPAYEVSTEVVAHETTQDIQVWAPIGEGSWPVVYAIPGIGGQKEDWDEAGAALARQGVVVFAPDYRATGSDDELTRDVECGYRYIRGIADEYGGDLSLPVTAVGYSRGASVVLSGMDETVLRSGGLSPECFQGAPRPDVVVAINGCYYAYEGRTFDFPAAQLGISPDTTLILLAGEADDVCPAWQSHDAARALEAAGHDVTLMTIAGANHYHAIFHDLVDGRWVTASDAAAGDQTVQIILDAIRAGAAP
jgi:dienelactone hydrolase